MEDDICRRMRRKLRMLAVKVKKIRTVKRGQLVKLDKG
jgi:hypothetical protein